MRIRLGHVFAVVMLLLVFLTACSVYRQNIAPVEAVSNDTKRTVNVPITTIKDEITLLLEKENYLVALATIHEEVENGYAGSSLNSEYLQALKGVLLQAEEQMAKGVLDEAGSNFQAVLERFPREDELARNAYLSAENIKAKIDTCADQLMEDGLLAYRNGNLETAIGIWEKILSFQPQHEASKKAIHTANLQLINLKSLEQKQ